MRISHHKGTKIYLLCAFVVRIPAQLSPQPISKPDLSA